MGYIRKSILTFSSLVLVVCLFFNLSVHAVYYGITGPSGEVVNGQEYEWTVTVDTQGQAITDGVAAVTFDTQYLQYVSTTPGDFFNSVSASPSATIVTITGTNLSAKSGTGTFAKIKFKLIAASSGSTELCTVAPVTTPTPTPAQATATPVPTSIVVTNTPTPTEIVQTGFANQWSIGIIAMSLIVLGIFGAVLL